jgi:hypothetical protein
LICRRRARPALSLRGGLAILVALAGLAGLHWPAAPPARAQEPVTVSYDAGWNLVGVTDGTPLPGVQGGLFELASDGSGYVAAENGPVSSRGYWAYFAVPAQIVLSPADDGSVTIDAAPAIWTLVGNPGERPVRLSGLSTAYGYDPVAGYSAVSVLAPGRGALVLPDAGGAITFTPAVDRITLVAPAGTPPTPTTNQLSTGGPAEVQPTSETGAVAAVSGAVLVIQAGFGQPRPGAPIAVAVLVQNTGAPTDGVPLAITAYDANGAVVAAGDTTLRYLGSGETTGFVRRLTAASGSTAARVSAIAGAGKPAGVPPTGALGFSDLALAAAHSGWEATAVLSSSFANDLSSVHVSAIAYDSSGAIDGGGETTKRLVPAGGSVGVVVSLDSSGTPASVQFYAQLP